MFDSHAILLHLAATHRRFLPATPSEDAEMLSWLLFVATGLSPFSGQAVHFQHHAPEPLAHRTEPHRLYGRRSPHLSPPAFNLRHRRE
ncbi:glutathione S-transferase [Paraburkholderia sp. GAS348]